MKLFELRAGRARTLVLFACCVLLNAPATAQSQIEKNQQRLQALLDRVPLPDAYMATSEYYIDQDQQNGSSQQGEQERQPTGKDQVWVSWDWAVGLHFLASPPVGYTPVSYSYGTLQESWQYLYDNRMAQRTSRFADWRHIAEEQECSPMYLVRGLKLGRATVKKIKEDSDSVTVTVSQPGLISYGDVVFDRETGQLRRMVLKSPAGKVAADNHFDDWRDIGQGRSVPFRIYQDGTTPGGAPMDTTTIVTEAKIIDASAPPARAELPSDFAIVDEIEGVTKRADGTVVDEIRHEAMPVKGGARPGFQFLSTRSVMAVGVVLILLAGLIFGIRRWRGM